MNKVGTHFLGFKVMMDEEARTDTHLIFSRDGLSWRNLPGAEPFLGRGREGDFDAGEAMAPKSIVPVDDHYHLYYSGRTGAQTDQTAVSSIGLAVIHRDRFVAQAAGEAGGYLLTREFVVEGDELRVNSAPTVHRPPRARFAVEVVRLPEQGYGFDDCDAEPRDLLDHHVTWRGRTLAPLRGQPVQLRFYLRNHGLYALRLAEAAG